MMHLLIDPHFWNRRGQYQMHDYFFHADYLTKNLIIISCVRVTMWLFAEKFTVIIIACQLR